ncbi:hypothetical protein T10_8506 [Trichinella papuae]|uniref:Uncharacterized protein n=1 Tax=Trichinella papuae TaxID=268474 RepID=A0A0V1M2B9_9BILA|nr:hypothetical protein T10_8506 [Trichinella papuae]
MRRHLFSRGRHEGGLRTIAGFTRIIYKIKILPYFPNQIIQRTCEFCGTLNVSRQLFTVNFKLTNAVQTFEAFSHPELDKQLSIPRLVLKTRAVSCKMGPLIVNVSRGTTCIPLNQMFDAFFIHFREERLLDVSMCDTKFLN